MSEHPVPVAAHSRRIRQIDPFSAAVLHDCHPIGYPTFPGAYDGQPRAGSGRSYGVAYRPDED